MLRNRLYTGDMIQNRRSRISYKYRKVIYNPKDQWIIVENTHEPLVSKEDFELVQNQLPAQTQRNDKKEIFLLDGLLKCADCGHNIGIRARRKNGKTSTVCNYYRKYKVEYKLCSSHGFDYDTLENGVVKKIKEVMKYLDSSNVERDVINKYNSIDALENSKINKQKLEVEINRLKSNLDKSYMDNLSGKISDDMFSRISNKINCDIETKTKKIEKLDKYISENENKTNSMSEIKKIIKEFMDAEHPTRELIMKIIKNISIHDDGNIDIYFNCNDLNVIYESCVA